MRLRRIRRGALSRRALRGGQVSRHGARPAAYSIPRRARRRAASFDHRGWGNRAAVLAKALALAKRATQLDDGDAIAQAALSYTLAFTGQTEASLAAARRAVTLNPNLPWAWAFLGLALIYNDQPAQALEALRRSILLGPHKPWRFTAYALLARIFYHDERYDDCIELARQAVALAPDHPQPHGYLAAALAQRGREAELREEVTCIRRLWPDFGIGLYEGFRMTPEHRAALLSGLRKAGLAE